MERKALPPFGALKAFEAVGRHGGIRKAAQALGIDHAVVSRHLRTLETWTGTDLINRSGGRITLTPKGARYHGRISAAIAEMMEASDQVSERRQAPRVHIWCVPGFGFQWLIPRLGAFRLSHSEIELDLRPTDQGPDFSTREADGDIRYVREWSVDRLPDTVRSLVLARPPVFPVASPALLAGHPAVQQASDLLSWPLLLEESEEEWRYWFTSQGIEVDHRLAGPRLWHAHMTLDAARRGQGVALANRFLLNDDIEAGRLVAINGVKQAFASTPLGGYCFIAREDRWSAPAAILFRQWLAKEVAAFGRE